MRFIFPKPLINPLAAEFFIYMLPFPVNRGVLPFTESHLTLCWLHKRQTSQVIFAVVAAAVEALTDIGEPSKLVSGKAKGENCSKIQPSLPQIRKENVSPWNLPHRTATTWLTSCEAECPLSIWGICGHVWISLIPNFAGAEGVAPPSIPRSKGGTPPLLNPPPPPPPSLRFWGECAPKNGHFFPGKFKTWPKGPEKKDWSLVSTPKGHHKLQRSKWRINASIAAKGLIGVGLKCFQHRKYPKTSQNSSTEYVMTFAVGFVFPGQ